MNTSIMLRAARLGTLGLLPVLVACNDNNSETTPTSSLELKARSVTPALVKALPGFENLQILPLISSDDVLAESPNFVFGPQPDGAGLMRNPATDGFVLINNHEISQSVSRVYLDKTFKPVKGELRKTVGWSFTQCPAVLKTQCSAV